MKRIYYLLSTCAPIRPTAGDAVTEIGIMRALSRNYEVFYNNERFDPQHADLGLSATSLQPVDKEYDLHIVRNNPKVFKQLSNPKLYFATPFDEQCFKEATAIYTFTDSWTQKLKEGYNFPYGAYPPNYKTDKGITLTQVVDERFQNYKSHPKTQAIREQFGGKFIIGHFGRIANSCYPYSFVAILPPLKEKYKDLNVVFCGAGSTIKKFGITHKIKTTTFAYEDMPYAISACDLILYNYRDGQGHVAGSMKILEAMACGVPVLCPRYDARIPELGADYELFYPYEDICATNAAPVCKRFSAALEKEMSTLLERAISDKDWLIGIGKKLRERAKFYSVRESAQRFKLLLDPLMSRP